MTPKEAVAVLRAAFPKHQDLPPETVRLYVKKLSDIAPELLETVVDLVIDRGQFFPSIAELRETAGRLAGLLPAGSEEALALVRQADIEELKFRRDGTYAYTERFWRWPDGIAAVTFDAIDVALRTMGDPVQGESRVFGWGQDFKKCYQAVAERTTRNALADLSHAALPRGPKALREGASP